METKTFNTIAHIRGGYQTRGSIEEDSLGIYHLIQGKDFDSKRQLNLDALVRFSPKRKPEPYFAKKEDIIFLARGSDHFSYYVKEKLENTLVSAAFYIIRIISKNILPEFLTWYMNQAPAQKYFRSKASGTVMGFVAKSVLEEMEINIPSLKIQERIDRIDSLWQKEQALRISLTEQRDQLIKVATLNAIKGKGEKI